MKEFFYYNCKPVIKNFLQAEGLSCQQTGATARRHCDPTKCYGEGEALGNPTNSFTMLGTKLHRSFPFKATLLIILLLFSITTCILFGITLTEPKMGYAQSKLKPGLSPEGRRDPFSLPPKVHLRSKGDTVSVSKGSLSTKEIKPSSPSLMVKAILISDRIRLASIDRYIVSVGDSIHDEKVLEIKNDRVILGKGNKLRTLLLYQSPVRITVEDK